MKQQFPLWCLLLILPDPITDPSQKSRSSIRNANYGLVSRLLIIILLKGGTTRGSGNMGMLSTKPVIGRDHNGPKLLEQTPFSIIARPPAWN